MSLMTPLAEAASLPTVEDVQGRPDNREISINRVGIKDILHPVTVIDRTCGEQRSIATFKMYVNLPHTSKGTHLSRLVQILNEREVELSVESVRNMLLLMAGRLLADSAHLEISFTYFVKKKAPVSGVQSLMNYQVCLMGEYTRGRTEIWLKVAVPTTSLCPCSKAISKYGAHNQRSLISLAARVSGPMWVEELIDIAENAASCEVYGLLKRPDEKFVTERAYDNPKFVEDTVRDVAAALNKDKRVHAYKVESENFESIHNHSAYAMIERRELHSQGAGADPQRGLRTAGSTSEQSD